LQVPPMMEEGRDEKKDRLSAASQALLSRQHLASTARRACEPNVDSLLFMHAAAAAGPA
jgi:hypothetical protein